MTSSSTESRIENLVSWFAASVLVATTVIYVMGRKDARRRHMGAIFANSRRPTQESLSVQLARAAEPGRGRKARAPVHIPWAGWKDILVRTYREIFNDRVLPLSAGVVFYSLVALFPAIAAGVSFYALFADAGTIINHLAIASDIIPGSAIEIIRNEIERIAVKSQGGLTFSFLFSFFIALWSANAGMNAVIDALNIIYDEREKRGLVRLYMTSLFFTFCAIVSALLAVSAVVVFPLILAAFNLSSFDRPLIGFLRWPFLFIVIIVGLSFLYRYGPSRRRPRWRWISIGSVFAAVAWLVMSSLFSWYLGNIANYNATYGALGAVVGLMMWMWLSTIVILVGAVLNSEIEHQTAVDSTIGPPKPMGARGAVMADTVGEASS